MEGETVMAQDMVADKNILNSEGFRSNLCARQCGKSEKRGEPWGGLQVHSYIFKIQ